MELIDYIKQCLEDTEFKKYWLEDNLPMLEAVSSFIETYSQLSELFESEDEYKDKLDSRMKNRGIKSDNAVMTIEFYEKANTCPVAEFLSEIGDSKLKEKTVKNIYNLSLACLNLNKTNKSSYVEDGIYELRTQQGSNIDRIFYFFVIGNKIILTNGYIKKTKKVDKAELKRAKEYRDEYSKRIS